MKHGKIDFLNRIYRPEVNPHKKWKHNLSNNEAAFGSSVHYPDTWPLYVAFRDEWIDHGCMSPADNVMPTNGAEDALRIVYSALVDKDSTVLRPNPVFGMIDVFEQQNQANTIKVDYGNNLKLDCDEFIESIHKHSSKLSLIYLALPDNPTGAAVSEQELDDILLISEQYNIPIVIDCTYYRYLDKAYRTLNINRWSNLIIIDSLSKSHGLAGLRVGAIITNTDMMHPLKALRAMTEVNIEAVKHGVYALLHNTYKINVKHTHKWQSVFRDQFEGYIPSRGNFILIRDERYEQWYVALKEKGILTRIDFDHKCMKGILRISIGSNRAMKRAKKVLQVIL